MSPSNKNYKIFGKSRILCLAVFTACCLVSLHLLSQLSFPYMSTTRSLTAANVSQTDIPTVHTRAHHNKSCTYYLIKNKNPNFRVYHFFHDMECIISAFYFQGGLSESCSQINMVVSDQYNYSRSAYSQLFTFTIMDRSEFAAHNETHYGCARAKDYDWTMVQFRRNIVARFALQDRLGMGYKSHDFYSTFGDILVVDRNKFRHIANLDELMQRLQAEYANTSHSVRLVYFDDMPLIEQYKCVLNASVVITPHGAAEVNFAMVNHHMREEVRVVELCPPYTHCWIDKADSGVSRRVSLCPHYYAQMFKMLRIHAVAREDVELGNCSVFWANKKSHKRNFAIDFKRVKGFKVSPQLVMEAIRSDGYHSPVFHIDKTSFGIVERAFYNSSVSLLDKQKRETFELYPSVT